jgi:tetratricopeptide (TPR) repeat protein
LGHLWLARCLLFSDQFTAAQTEAQQLIQLDPQNEEAYLISAVAHWRNNRYTDAIKAAQQCKRIQPNETAYRVIGQAYMEMNKWNDAVKALTEANKLDSQNAETHFQLGLCFLRLNRRSDARRELQAVVAIDPNNQAARDALRRM